MSFSTEVMTRGVQKYQGSLCLIRQQKGCDNTARTLSLCIAVLGCLELRSIDLDLVSKSLVFERSTRKIIDTEIHFSIGLICLPDGPERPSTSSGLRKGHHLGRVNSAGRLQSNVTNKTGSIAFLPELPGAGNSRGTR
jgi:hypothetical protein